MHQCDGVMTERTCIPVNCAEEVDCIQPQSLLKSAWRVAKHIFHAFGLALTISSRQEGHLKETAREHMTRINPPPPTRLLLRVYLLNTSVSTLFSHWNLNLIRPSGETRDAHGGCSISTGAAGVLAVDSCLQHPTPT